MWWSLSYPEFFFLMFALSRFSGPDYHTAWNRLVHKTFIAINLFVSGKKDMYYNGDISFHMRGLCSHGDSLRNISKKDAM